MKLGFPTPSPAALLKTGALLLAGSLTACGAAPQPSAQTSSSGTGDASSSSSQPTTTAASPSAAKAGQSASPLPTPVPKATVVPPVPASEPCEGVVYSYSHLDRVSCAEAKRTAQLIEDGRYTEKDPVAEKGKYWTENGYLCLMAGIYRHMPAGTESLCFRYPPNSPPTDVYTGAFRMLRK